MIKSLYKNRPIIIALAIALVTALFVISAAALTVREGASPSDANNPSDSAAADSGTNTDTAADDTSMTDSAVGTGEFADDTSNTSDTSAMGGNSGGNDSVGPVESAVDNVVTDAGGVVSDVVNGAEDAVTGGSNMSIWGIVIAIIIIAAIGFLIFAFFSKKK